MINQFIMMLMDSDIVHELPDIPRIYTAIAEWFPCLIFILLTKRRFNIWKTSLLSAGFLAVQCGMQVLAGFLPLAYWVPGMIVAAGLMFLYIYTCAKVNIYEAGYLCVKAFIIAEFMASFEWQLYCYYFINIGKSFFAEVTILIGIYGVGFAGLYFLERRYKTSNIHVKVSVKDFISAMIIVVAIFIISNISFVSKNTPFSGRFGMEIFYIRTLVDLCGVVLMYAQQEQRFWLYAKRELYAMQNILDRQYQQYCQSKDNIEHINRTYHDLKHQIAIIREEKSPEKKQSYLNSLESGIKMYEAQNKTGNSVLDTVLTSKSMICNEKKINFTCVADGTLLEFMDVMDICSIFGNALDNAIESVSKVADKDKRLIKTAVFSQGELLMIRISNYYENKLKFDKGTLVTTKAEKSSHGYGIKSIKIAAIKYGGTVKIATDDNWFTLCVLLPMRTA